jgi:energy-coupling factor transport system substrate-specific component
VTLPKFFQKILTAIAFLLAVSAFSWPLFLNKVTSSEAGIAQTAFMLLMPLLLILILVEITAGETKPQQLALLAVLTALNSVIRMLGAGFAGIETAFFLIVIASYIFRSRFGFAFGSLSILVSALLTGGVGPWLPFQMMAAGLIGFGAGLLPKASSTWKQVSLLVFYAVFASFSYGALMTLWNWPFLAGLGTSLSFEPGAGFVSNLQKFWQYQIFTGGLLWDAGRAITTSILIFLTAPALLTTLRRAASRAGIKN